MTKEYTIDEIIDTLTEAVENILIECQIASILDEAEDPALNEGTDATAKDGLTTKQKITNILNGAWAMISKALSYIADAIDNTVALSKVTNFPDKISISELRGKYPEKAKSIDAGLIANRSSMKHLAELEVALGDQSKGKLDIDNIIFNIDVQNKTVETGDYINRETIREALKYLVRLRQLVSKLQRGTRNLAEDEYRDYIAGVNAGVDFLKEYVTNFRDFVTLVAEAYGKKTNTDDKTAKEESVDGSTKTESVASDLYEKAETLIEAAMALKALDEDANAAGEINPAVFVAAANIMAEDTDYMKTPGDNTQDPPADPKPEDKTNEYDPTVNGANADNAKPDMEETKELAGEKGTSIMTDDDGCHTQVECVFFGL